jgi:hypothetical protein
MRLLNGLLILLGLVAAQNTELQYGIPYQHTVAAGESQYYSIDLTSATLPIVVTVTPYGYGDPDLYASRQAEHPTQDTAEWWARSFGEDALTFTPSDYAGYDTLYFTVYGYLQTNYTIVAVGDEPIALINGVPQSQHQLPEESRYFTFTIPDPSAVDHVSISAVAETGSIVIFASTNGIPDPLIPSTYQFVSSYEYNGQALIISSSSNHWPTDSPATFYIGVFARTPNDANYHITVHTDDTHVLLQDGIPAHGHVDAGDSKYYLYQVTQEGCDLDVQLTELTGDPDLYISTTHQYPTPANAEHHSIAYGSDHLHFADAAATHYYILVLGWENSTYTVMATLTCDTQPSTYVQLTDGSPQSATLETNLWKYYRITVGSPTDLTIAVTRTYGDPDLYVTTSVDDADVSNSNYIWRSVAYGGDSLTITDTDEQFCTDCTYYIGVYAYQSTAFTIVATSSEGTTTLQEGQSVQATVHSGTYSYFKCYVDNVIDELTITITPLARGDPDLYISVNPSNDPDFELPTRTDFVWDGLRVGGDSVSIPRTDENFCTQCWYYISVYGFTTSTFSILAHYGGTAALQDGVPQVGHADKSEMIYYSFGAFRGHDEFTVSVTPTIGTVTLFMSSNGEYPEPHNTDTYQWESNFYNAIKTIQVFSDDDLACPQDGDCEYIIGVYGFTNSSYSIVAQTAAATVVLQNGVAQLDNVQTGAYEYFSFEVNEPNMNLTITVTALNGDPDLYVSTTTARPTNTDYEYDSIHWGTDSVHLDNAAVGTYYIGVHGFLASDFSITALLTDEEPGTDAITLIEGHPQNGDLETGRYRYYTYRLLETTAMLTFTLTTSQGDPDLYITNDGTVPSNTHYTWESMTTSTDVVRIHDAAPGSYSIAVYSYRDCSYTLTVSSSESSVTLQDGVPLNHELEAHEWAYYVIPVNSMQDLTVTLTSITGDPDLYVSTIDRFPDGDNHQWSSLQYLSDSVTIPHTDDNFCLCNFYIGVYAWTATSYAITASFSNAIILQDGNAATGTVTVHGMVYYQLTVSDGATDLTISVSPLTGNAHLYVSHTTLPETTDYVWASEQWTGGSLTIHRNDGDWPCQPGIQCVFYIGVYGVSQSDYSLVATTSDAAIVLRNGVPVTEWVGEQDWEYFTFTVDQADTTLRVSITPSSGDPDLYISMGVTPTRTEYDWDSIAYGADAITIPSAEQGVYVIGVYGWRNSSYTILAVMETSEGDCQSTTLIAGNPQNALLTQGEYHCYSITLNQQYTDLTISVTRIVGDPDIYVTTDGSEPSRDNYNYASINYGTDVLTIYSPPVTTIRIAVYAFLTSQYTIVASTDESSHTLLDGVPFTETLRAGQFDYFEIGVAHLVDDLTVTVTSFNGDPDLFISRTNQHPSLDDYDYDARSVFSDSITIPSDELVLGTYYIAVQAWTNTTFTILAHFDSQVQLIDGVSQSGQVSKEASRYYTFVTSDTHNDISISVTPSQGTVWLYVSANREPLLDDDESIDWYSVHYEGTQSLVISHTDENFCVNCVYFVLVYGVTDAEFVVQANTNLATVRLQSGYPFTSSVSQGEYRYFQVTNPLYFGAITVTVTPFSGDPDLYVSVTTQTPTSSDFDWVSMAYGADHITVDYSSEGYAEGEWYIGVYGWSNSTFTITVNLQDLTDVDDASGITTTLIDGVPQTGLLLEYADIHYYTFYLGDSGNLTVTVTPSYGDPDLYITDDGTLPGPEADNGWESLYYGRDSIVISDGCRNCQYIIAVNCYSHTLYTIVASSTASASVLQSGRPISGFVQQDEWQYYRFQASLAGLPMILALNSLTGDPDLYVSTTISRPNREDAELHSAAVGSDVLTINAADVRLGWYYIGVYGWRSSSYTLTVTLGDITLVAGQPYSDVLDAGSARYYSFSVPAESDSLTVLTSLQFLFGEASVYITTEDNQNPGPNNYMWSSTEVNLLDLRNTLTIEGADRRSCVGCTYYMAVVARTHASYSITVSFGGLNVLLASGQAVDGYLDAGEWNYYYAFVDDADHDISIDVTTYLGNVDMYVSTTNANPSSGSSTWSDSSDGSLHISIPLNDHDFVVGIYYIGIYASTHSRYSVVLSTESTRLTDGSPVHGSIPPALVNYYFYYHNDDSDLRLDLSRVATSQNSNGPFQVYITTSEADDTTTTPDQDHHIWYKFLSFGQHMVILPNDANYCTGCTYYIAVYGVEADEYEMRMTGSGDYAVLLNEQYVYGLVPFQQYMYYETFVDVAVHFTVRLESCTGNADLYMSQNTYTPSRSSYTWRSENVNSNDQFTVNDESIVQAGFYIGVHGEPQNVNSSYRLTVHTHSETVYGADFPVPGDNGGLKVFFGDGGIEITFREATSPTGSALTYTAYYSRDDSGVVMYSMCGLDYAYKSKEHSGPNTDSELTIKISNQEHSIRKEHTYRVNVAVVDADGHYAVYEWTQITASEDFGSQWYILVGAIAVILLMVCVCYLVVKNRRLTQELEVEMGDIPKAVVRKATRGPASRPQQKGTVNYAQLLADTGDEDGDYEPPPM